MATILGTERTGDGQVVVQVDLGVTTIGAMVMPADVFYAGHAQAAVDALAARMLNRDRLLRGGPQ